MRPPTPSEIRARFPALSGDAVFLDNAGGSQLPDLVINAVREALVSAYAQYGGAYGPSARAKSNLDRGRAFVRAFLGAGPEAEVILGPSSTALCNLVARMYADAADAGTLDPARRELIVCSAGHEANIGCWHRLAARGFTIREWHARRPAHGSGEWRPHLDDLKSLLSSRTLLVAFPQVSNILGEVWDAAGVARLAREAGARSFIDGVAYAPHHAPSPAAMGCDYYVFSGYKVFGPHAGGLYARKDALSPLSGPNHTFIAKDSISRFEPGNTAHEAAAAWAAVPDFFAFLSGGPAGEAPSREVIERAFTVAEPLELALQAQVLEVLETLPGVNVIGPREGHAGRVSTISFVCSRPSSEVATAANEIGLGIRFGNFYSRRLVEQMGLAPDQGVVRVSPLLYNTSAEIDSLARFLRRFLK